MVVGFGFDVMVVDMLEGDKVYMIDGDDVGKIKDIMFDVCFGCIVYVVLLSGGIFGIGDKLYVILWSVLMFDIECKCFLLLVLFEWICNVLGFDKDYWLVMVDL